MTSPAAGAVQVLHVDDEPEFVEMAAEFLMQADDRIEVDIATSATAGLDRIEKTSVDCVVSDFDMPGQDGIEFLESVRETRPDLPFILYTGKGSEAVASDAISAGVTDYLQKQPGQGQYQLLANRILDAVEHQRSKANYREIFEKAPDGIVIHYPTDGSFVDMNTEYAEMFGYRSTEAFLAAGFEAIHPDDPPYTVEQGRALVKEALETGPQTFEWPGIRKDGSRFWAEVHLTPVELHGADRVLAAVRDVTDRKDREQELEYREQIVQTMNDVAVIVQEGDIKYASPRVSELVGYTPAALDGESMLTFIAPEYRETVAERHIARVTGDDEDPPPMYEIELISDAGERIPVEINVNRITYDGEPATLSLVRDISERKAKEEDLRQLNEEYQTVFETAQDGIFLFDVDRSGGSYEFRLRRLNPSHEAISGLSSTADRGKTPRQLLGDDEGAEVAANYRRCVEAMEPISYEERLEMPSGTIHWHTNLAPVIEDGEVTQIVGISRDVTDQKAQERQLRRQNERLEEFASVVSHDLRNPLNVAEGRLELAMDDDESENLNAVARSLDRMETLIDDMLTLASAGNVVGEPTSVDLSTLAASCWQTVETESATLNVETDAVIRADETRLTQLVENLLRNAIDHGGPAVTITVGELPDGFYVEDDGPGIPDDERAQVLEPGYSTTEGGIGFGLSIVRNIAEAHGWEIGVGSSPDGGARFEFTGVEPR